MSKKHAKWDESITLSKQDKLFKDAIITASVSASTEVAEDLLSYFVDIGNRECFAATLFSCYDLVRPDVVMELTWQHGLNDFYMPYKIQSQRTLVEKVRPHVGPSVLSWLILCWMKLKKLEADVKEQSKKVLVKEEAEAEVPIINPGFGNKLLLTQGG